MFHHRTFEHLGILAICLGIVACINQANETLVDMDRSYRVISSNTSTMAGEMAYAVRRKRMLAFTGWSPHWMNARFPLKYLKDPQKVFGENQGIWTMTRQGLTEEYPEIGRFLRQFRWRAADMERLSLICHEQNDDYRSSARQWLQENPALVRQWLQDVRPQPGASLELVSSGHPYEKAVNALVRMILEKKLDCRVHSIETTVAGAYNALADGSGDLFVTAWLLDCYKKDLDRVRDRIEMVACNLPDAEFGIAVPVYAPVESIADLKNYHREFGGRIFSTRPEKDMVHLAQQAILAYGLNDPIATLAAERM